jgi:hypothetical protein
MGQAARALLEATLVILLRGQALAAGILLFDIDGFIGLFEKAFGRALRPKKPRPKKTSSANQVWCNRNSVQDCA